jgi:hypothetical protein
MMPKSLSFGLVLLLLAVVSGCSHVHAYERGKLAHPSMAPASLVGPGEEHMYSVHEGATGGDTAGGGGCGCN